MPMRHHAAHDQGETVVLEANRAQLEYFTAANNLCRGLQLPEGILLRYNLVKSLYFYMRTSVHDGKIITQVSASDSPYEREKTDIGAVTTPLFDRKTHQMDELADQRHLEKLEALLDAWVTFVKDAPESSQRFASFPVDPRPGGRRHYGVS